MSLPEATQQQPSLHGARARSGGGRRVLEGAAEATPLLALAFFFVAAVRAGLPTAHAVRALLTITITQILPGAVVWRTVRSRDRGWRIEDVLMGFAVGAALAIAGQAIAGAAQIKLAGVLLGPAAASIIVAVPSLRHRARRAATQPLPLAWGPAVAGTSLVLLIPAQAFYRRIPLSWSEGFVSFYVDMPFHLSLAAQLAHRDPSEVAHVLGEPLNYHWFSHAWVAQVANSGSVPLDSVLYRIMPSVISVVLVGLIAAVAVRVSGKPWAGLVAASIAVLAGDFDLVTGSRPAAMVNHLSPSLGLSSIFATALVAALVSRWRNEGQMQRATLGIVVVLAVAAAGTKGSALPIVVAGAGLAWLVAILRRWPTWRRVTADLVVLVLVLLCAFLLLFDGGTGQLHLDPVGAVTGSAGTPAVLAGSSSGGVGMALAAAILLAAVLMRGAGLIAAWGAPTLRSEPVIPLLAGTGVAGALALLTFDHPGGSQTYFLRNAMPALAIGSAVGLTTAWYEVRYGRLRWLIGAIATGVLAVILLTRVLDHLSVSLATTLLRLGGVGAVVTSGWMAARLWVGRSAAERPRAAFLGSCLCIMVMLPGAVQVANVPLPPAVETVPPDARRAFSSDQVEAARWLRDHSEPTDIVATNRHCGVLEFTRCDSRRFLVAAYTERRVLVEGWAYTRSWATSPEVDAAPAYKPFWDPQRLAGNDQFFNRPTQAGASWMQERGVEWLFVDKLEDYATDIDDYATVRYETEWALVLEFDRST